MQYIELSPVAAFLQRVNIITAPAGLLANWCWYASLNSLVEALLIDFAGGGNGK